MGEAKIYVASTFVQRAIPFLLLPVLTKYLAPAEYRSVAVFQALLAIALPFLGTCLPAAVGKEFHQVEREQMRRLVGNVVAMTGMAGALLAVVLGCVSFVWDSFFGIPVVWFIGAALMAPLLVVGRVNLTLLRFVNRPATFAAIEIAGVIVNVSISVGLVVAVGLGWRGRVLGVLVGPAVVGALGVWLIYRAGYFKWVPSLTKMKQVFWLTLPVSMHMVSSAFMTGIDRLFIDVMVGKEQVGIYSVGFSFGMIVYMLLQSFHQAWGPRMLKTLAEPSAEGLARLVRLTYLHDVGTLLLAIAVGMGAYVLIPLMTAQEYHGSVQYVVWIAFGFAINGMYSIRTYYLLHSGKTAFLGVLAFVVVLVNIASNYVLIRWNGPVGAAQATIIAYGVRFVSVWWYSHRVHPMPWRMGRGR